MRYLKAVTALVTSFVLGMNDGVTLHDWVATAVITLGVFVVPNKDVNKNVV